MRMCASCRFFRKYRYGNHSHCSNGKSVRFSEPLRQSGRILACKLYEKKVE